MVVLQPSKLATRVRFPSPAFKGSTFEAVLCTAFCARIAQLAEHFLGKEEVGSSILLPGFAF